MHVGLERNSRQRRGFSLFELLTVVTILGILAALALPSLAPDAARQLESAGHLVAADLTYARSLAVSNSSDYTVSFDTDENTYVLTHTGDNASLDTLPDSSLRDPSDPDDQQIVRLDELPNLGGKVRLYVVRAGTAAVRTVEFGPLGSTTRTAETEVWLQVNAGSEPRWLPVVINPVTGLATVGEMVQTAPVTAASLGGGSL